MFERVWIGLHKLLMNSLYSKIELNPQDYHGNFEERVPRIYSNQSIFLYLYLYDSFWLGQYMEHILLFASFTEQSSTAPTMPERYCVARWPGGPSLLSACTIYIYSTPACILLYSIHVVGSYYF